MNFSINLGSWNSIFAIPSDIVDKHLKLAGAAQLKVLLWVLRHAGSECHSDDIANALSMHPADVKDAMQYWIEHNIISNQDNKSPQTKSTGLLSEPTVISNNKLKLNNNINKNPVEEKTKPRSLSRPHKPDSESVAKRISESDEIGFLMQEAQIILGRPISNNDSAALVMFHDTDGLPVDVIIMLIQYAVSVGKSNMKYIEKVAIDWGNEEIDTLEKAEIKIRKLNNHNKAWKTVQRVCGLESRSPTSKEDELSDKWLNEWKFNEDMIKEAFERCIYAKGKYTPNYMDAIIKRWYMSSIKNLQQAKEEIENRKSQKTKYTNSSPSYDIDEYENFSIFDSN